MFIPARAPAETRFLSFHAAHTAAELLPQQLFRLREASGALGSEAQVLDGILGGGDTVDISRLSAFALTSYGWAAFS